MERNISKQQKEKKIVEGKKEKRESGRVEGWVLDEGYRHGGPYALSNQHGASRAQPSG